MYDQSINEVAREIVFEEVDDLYNLESREEQKEVKKFGLNIKKPEVKDVRNSQDKGIDLEVVQEVNEEHSDDKDTA